MFNRGDFTAGEVGHCVRSLTYVLVFALVPKLYGQTPVVIQNEKWTTGVHEFSVAEPILSPDDPTAPVSVSSAADVLFKSGVQVRLKDGFHAGMFNGTGRFHAHIDPTIFPVPGPSAPTIYQQGEITDIESRTIDLGKAVGAIDGTASVSANGSANYSIPIPLPPGTNGMAPGLAIVYDSHGGDGLLGTGWALSGLSSIIRSGKIFFHDQSTTPIQFGPDDRFWLDGQRLVLTSGGTYGAAGTVYDTEAASFAAITAVGTYGNGPGSFSMITKGGITMEYGTHGSTVRTTDGQEILIWRLSRVRDAYGNTVKYTYADIDGEPLLSGISYTGNDDLGLNAFCTVRFDYSLRSDPGMLNLPRRPLSQRHLLDRITVAVTVVENGAVTTQPYRTLELKYALRDIGKSYLTEIVEHGRDNAATLNSTVFQYGEQPVDLVEGTGISIPSSEQSDIYAGDYDGDGRSDILRVYYTIDQGEKHVTEFRIYPTTNSLPYVYTLNSSSFHANLANTGLNHQSFRNADFNGDGKDDICVVYYDYFPGGSNAFHFLLRKIQLFLSTPSDFVGYTIVEYDAPDNIFSYIKDPTNSIQFGDFDGDGKSELILHCVNPNDLTLYKLYMLEDGVWTDMPVPVGTDGNLKNPDRLMVVDGNGDGKHDLLALKSYPNDWNHPNTCSVFSWNGGVMENISTSGIPYTTVTSSPGGDPVYAVYPGDFNGDGKTDLLVNANLSSTHKWRIYFSNGQGYTDSYAPFTFSPAPAWPDDRFRIVVADFNGDGRSDILHSIPSSGWGPHCKMYYSVGHSNGEPIFYPDWVFLETALGTLIPCDQNGDGRADIISFIGWTQPLGTLLIKPQGQERLLQKVSNGVGALDEFVYGPALDNIPLTGPDTDRTWPIIRKRPVTDLVLAHLRPDGIGGTITTNFTYDNPYFELTGRGFLGFGKLRTTEGEWQLLNTSEVQEAHALLLPKSSKETNTTYGQVSNKQFTPSVVGLSNGRFTVDMIFESVVDFLSNTGKITTRLYDTNGNVIQTSVTSSTFNPTDLVYEEVTSTEYEAYGPSLVPAKPTTITVQSTRTGMPQVSKTTKLEYNTRGALFRKTDFFGTPGWVKSELNFNARGLVTKKTMTTAESGPNGGQEETYAYDPTGRFVTTQQTKYYDGATYWMTSTTDYDPFSGLPTKVTDAAGLKKDLAYDAFGHLISESAPYRNAPDPTRTITHALEWDVQAPTKYYRTTTHDPAAPDVTTWYDQLGRQTSQETETFGGAYTTSATSYDYLGRVQRVTAPHLPGEPEVYEEKTYDPLDRVVTSTSSVSGTTTFAYSYENGLSKVTATSPGPANHVTVTTKDCTGLTVSSTDDGGTLDHTYDSWGNLLTVEHGGTTIISNTYDDYGRQTELVDAAAGTTFYTYDAWGRLIYQEDANGNAIDLTYDNLGRLKTKGDISYSYYHEGDRFADLPVSITEGAATTTYTYDDLLRLTSTTKVIDGETFTTQYTYDAYDNVATMQYPSGITVGYVYAQHCFLDQVTYGGVTLYDAIEANGQGQIKTYALGDGKTTQITYTDGRPTRFYADGVQDLNMVYDPATGNLTSRWDKLVQRKESFAYDALDRLTGATVDVVNAAGTPTALVAQYTYGYDGEVGNTAGDLIQRTDIGKFNYSPGHAPTHAFGNTPGATAPWAINQGTQAISYTAFLKAETISEQIGDDAYQLTYTYGTDHQRAKSELKKNGTGIETRIYVGAYEEQRLPGTTNKIHYVDGPGGLCAMIVQANGTESIYYVYKDHLGSIVTLTTEQGGVVSIAAQQNFDPWGRRRNPADWTYEDLPTLPDWLYRGFTGHEHVEPFALVNMNGRMYDPLNGRMLSADNYVNGAFDSQAFNRYSYACNNPLKYTDPDGNVALIDDAVLGIIGGFANLISNWGNIADPWQGLTYFGFGFVSGAVSTYITPMGAAMLAGALNAGYQGYQTTGSVDPGLMIKGAVISGAVSGLSMGLGNAIGPSMDKLFGGISSPVLRGSLSQGVAGAGIGAFGGGLGASMGGGNFWEGAKQGAVMGLGTGLATGAYGGFLSARGQGVNPWTGAPPKKLYRAVSHEELVDIQGHGMRPNPDQSGYQEQKLFATSPSDADAWGQDFRNSYGQQSTVIEILVPNRANVQMQFTQMDGRIVIMIQVNQLPKLNKFGIIRPFKD